MQTVGIRFRVCRDQGSQVTEVAELRARADAAFHSIYRDRKGVFYLILAFTLSPFLAFLISVGMSRCGLLAENIIPNEIWREISQPLACIFALVLTAIWFLPVALQKPHDIGFIAYFSLACYSALSVFLAYVFWLFILVSPVPKFAAIWGAPATRVTIVEGFTSYTRKGTPHIVIQTSATDVDFYQKEVIGRALPEIGDVITFSGKETAFGFAFDYELP